VEIHHILGMNPAVLDLPGRLGAPYEVFLHDYSWICPRITLVAGDRRYCGEPELAACERCVSINGSLIEEDISVADLRTRSARTLAGAARVIVPTRDVARRLARYFPRLKPVVSPWEPEPIAARPPRREADALIRVAVLGAIGEHKGYARLLDCARDARSRDLPLEFVVMGHTEDDHPLFETGRVFVTGRYEEDEVAALLEREACDVALLPSVWPETWCYALTHLMASGLPIVTFDLGAMAERLRGMQRARLLPLDTDAATLNATLIAAAGPRAMVALRTWDQADAWIKSFRIDIAGAAPADIRYSALTGDEDQTPWTCGPTWCADPAGARPLMGFAARLHGALAMTHRCEYAGAFSSGARAAAAEGAPCRSPTPNDPLVGMRVTLAAQSVSTRWTQP
jgi:hypothetical protein